MAPRYLLDVFHHSNFTPVMPVSQRCDKIEIIKRKFRRENKGEKTGPWKCSHL